MSHYAIYGPSSRTLLTRENRVIVHDNRAELEFILPMAHVVPVSDAVLREPCVRLRDLPEFSGLTFPLRREDFIDPR